MRMLAPCALLLACAPAAAQEPVEITQALLDEIVAAGLPQVRQQAGAGLEHGVRVRISDAHEVERILAQENAPVLRMAAGGEEEARRMAEELAASLASALLAKYAWSSREILVCPENFRVMADVLGRESLRGLPVLRAVVVHELVHAAADQRFDLAGCFAALPDAAAVQAFNAVVEGHAQHVARRVCAELGWSEGFEDYTGSITAPPLALEGEGEGVKLLARNLTSVFAVLYRDGERFVAYLAQEGGDAALERAFREPPASVELVSAPEWYLHPERRPRLLYELDGALDAVAADFPAERWITQRITLASSQLESALAPLSAEEIEPIQRALRQARVLTATGVDQPGERLVAVALMEFAASADAQRYLTTYERLQKARDAIMQEGAVRILEAHYAPLRPPLPQGIALRKTLAVGGQEAPLIAVAAARGSLVVEALVSNWPDYVQEELWALAVRALDSGRDHLRAPADPPADAAAAEPR
ncbi:MAG: hypothetical protein EYC70_13220 [Planctomycetota bacterium]|nr:MAG: hypothetical protein EYC70_13220 [Planctomycetota bacterium]